MLRVLAGGPARFCQIRRQIPGISDRLLAKRLVELRDEGLIEQRESDGDSYYSLSARGEGLLPALDAIDAVKDVVTT